MSPAPQLSLAQRLARWLLPHSWSKSIEAQSRQWMAECPCGHGRSIWELGGIRWKAVGQPRRLIRCPKCSQVTWHKVVWREKNTK